MPTTIDSKTSMPFEAKIQRWIRTQLQAHLSQCTKPEEQ